MNTGLPLSAIAVKSSGSTTRVASSESWNGETNTPDMASSHGASEAARRFSRARSKSSSKVRPQAARRSGPISVTEDGSS